MADQKRWFKVWCSIGQDPAFLSLPLDSLARWTLLGAWVAVHGNKGTITATETAIRVALRIPDDVTVMCALMLPNVSFEEGKNRDGTFTVTMNNWHKYQADSTGAERMKTLRSKRRREEKRGEERKEPPVLLITPPSTEQPEWPAEWCAIRDLVQTLPFLAKHGAWLADLSWWTTMDELFTSCPARLDRLLREAVAYCESEGYVPRTKKAIRQKLKNCMEFSARKAERDEAERRHRPPA